MRQAGGPVPDRAQDVSGRHRHRNPEASVGQDQSRAPGPFSPVDLVRLAPFDELKCLVSFSA